MSKSRISYTLSGSVLLLMSVWLVNGCGSGPPVEPSDEPPHQTRFTETLGDADYHGTETCLTCHADHAADIMQTAHWNWGGAVDDIEGLEDQTHGKVDLINDY